MDATQCLKGRLNPEKRSMGSARWRDSNFKPGGALPCGCLDFSPVAFPLGHTVRLLPLMFIIKAEDGIPLTEHRETHHFTNITD